jgi:hypothetical protein
MRLHATDQHRYPRQSDIGALEDSIKIAEEQTTFNPLRFNSVEARSTLQVAVGSQYETSLTMFYWRDGTTRNVLDADSAAYIKEMEDYVTNEHGPLPSQQTLLLKEAFGTHDGVRGEARPHT